MKWEIILREWKKYKAKSRHRQRHRRLNRAKQKAEQKYPTYTQPVPKVNSKSPVEKPKTHMWAWILVWGTFACVYLWWTLPEMAIAVMIRKIWKEEDVFQAIAEVLIRRFYRVVEWIEDMTDIVLIEGFDGDIDIL